ncbi:peptidylprolyl isomerase [Yoonia sp. 208BN28-4]|uniref:peptidylprolyl isomerase n=1 Tax=Yoonia sp. 208BN28-4 TaxID=3126505 RepID=UPI0030ADB434
MRIHTTLLGSAALMAGLATAASAQDADTVIATVGDTEITLGQMIITRAQLPQQYAQLPDDVLFIGILDQLIQQQLLADALGDAPARVEYALENERRTLMAGETINDITREAITDEAVQAAYDERFADVEPATEYNASHLLVETEEEAIAAKARVEDDGEEFADVARDVSTGPTGPNGGNLGWFGAGQMVPEFEQAVMDMEVGSVAGPVQTQFGWHVIALNEVRDAELPSLDSVRQEITGQLQEAAIQERLTALEEEITVTRPEEGAFDPALISNLDLLEP